MTNYLLKIVLFVTFPVWFVLLAWFAAVYIVVYIAWAACCAIVDPTPPRYSSGKRAP